VAKVLSTLPILQQVWL